MEPVDTSRYPEWLDGRHHVLRPGWEFSCHASTAAARLRAAGTRQRVNVSVTTVDGCLHVQARLPSPSRG